MAALTPFSYRYGASLIHTMDARVKLGLLIILSLSSLNASITGLFSLTLLLFSLFLWTRIPLGATLKELQYLFILLGMVFTARLLSTEGRPLITVSIITITENGIFEGLMVCWRILTVVLLGLVFMSSTTITDIKWATARFLSYIPFIPEKRASTMMGLIVRFIPVIFQKSQDISEAQHARCVANRKNPFYRLKSFALPLLHGVFQDADKLAAAMAARCYHEDQPVPHTTPRKIDWVAFGAGCVIASLTVLTS